MVDLALLEEEAVEVVPQLPEFYEVINGQVVEVSPMSAPSSLVANRLLRALNVYMSANPTGEAGIETLFRLPLAGDQSRNRRPDAYYVSYERWPVDRPVPEANAWDVVPDLAVEVVSPSDFFVEVWTKIDEYFRAGVRLVWVILPIQRRVLVLDSATSVKVLTDADELTGGDVLPGFAVKLDHVFLPAAPPS